MKNRRLENFVEHLEEVALAAFGKERKGKERKVKD
jgi:hypothetical protein